MGRQFVEPVHDAGPGGSPTTADGGPRRVLPPKVARDAANAKRPRVRGPRAATSAFALPLGAGGELAAADLPEAGLVALGGQLAQDRAVKGSRRRLTAG